MKNTRTLKIALLFSVSLIFLGCQMTTDIADNAVKAEVVAPEQDMTGEDVSSQKEAFEMAEDNLEEKKDEFTILMAGDIIYHMPIVNSCYDTNLGTFDFRPPFRLIQPMIEGADIAIVNFETSINPEKPWHGFPLFNTPEESLWALKEVGFDIVNTCHNHSLDQGEQGLLNVLDAAQRFGLVTLGTQHMGEGRVRVIPLSDYKVGLFSYTYGLNGNEWMMEAEKRDAMINVIDRRKIREDIESLQAKDVDFILGIMHWGDEYHEEPSNWQQQLGREMIELGANAIIGSHPHVVQSGEYYQLKERTGPIIYSLGNFLSNQYQSTMGNVRSEDGLMVKLWFREENKQLKLTKLSFHPTWVYRQNGQYTIMPLREFFDGTVEYPDIPQQTLEHMRKSMEITLEKMNKIPQEF